MFQAIVIRAQRSIDTLVSKYVTRIAVAVPFVIALGFGIAAANARLSDLYGAIAAHTILAGAFGVIGLVAAAAIAAGSSEPSLETSAASAAESGASSTESASQSEPDVTPDALLAALAMAGPSALPILLRHAMRNLPLLLAIGLLAYLLFSQRGENVDPAASAEVA